MSDLAYTTLRQAPIVESSLNGQDEAMDKSLKSKRTNVSVYAVKTANSKLISSKASSNSTTHAPVIDRFVSRDEIRAAFKSAAQKLKHL